MKTIDVEGLPEPVAQAIQNVVETLRGQLREVQREPKHRPPVELPIWPGNVIGDLTRKEIYEDVG